MTRPATVVPDRSTSNVSRAGGHVVALGVYLALTILLAWPLVAAPGAWVPHDLGDPLLSTWTLWWNATRLPFTEAWWNGPMFHPAPGALALSDHRVGISLITTPLIASGVSPLAAHNVAWLLSYFLSAATAYALAHAVAGRRSAAFIGGLVYGFHPFRAEHLPHLELLSSYWLPLVLLALHRWVTTSRRSWLALLSVALILVAFTTGYYFFFLGVLIGLWLVWFVPWHLPGRRYAELGAALALPFVPLAPVLLGYRSTHRQFGLARSITEIEELSADVRGLVTPPEPLAFWNGAADWRPPEGALFPGLTAVALVAVALWVSRQRPGAGFGRGRARTGLLILAIAVGLVALVPVVWGPVEFQSAGLRVSVSQAYKPMSVATVLLLAWGLTSAAIREAWRAHTPLPFYAMATLAMWVFALGPTARLMGERVLYKAPYSWLMLLPGFADGFRAPARFAMLAALCLAVAAPLAFVRLTSAWAPRARMLAAALIAVGVLMDGWVYPFPFEPAPAPMTIPSEVPADAAVLELPIGVFEDAAAMYHGTQHGRPVVNGLSGFEPPHYGVLRSAIRDGDTGTLEVLAAERPLAVFLTSGAATADTMSLLPRQSRARHVAATSTHQVFLLAARPRARTLLPDAARVTAISGLEASVNADLLARTQDGDRRTAWFSGGPQRGGEHVTLTLGSPGLVSGVVLSLGAFSSGFPRALTVSVAEDDVQWRTVWEGPTGARAVAAALDDPRELRIALEFAPAHARHVRLLQTGQSLENEWAVAELSVLAQR